MSLDPLARVPVTIVTGFLGSGKTTLLNYLLSEASLGRTAALVNDFGAIGIDAELVSRVADQVVQLTNGCVCCTINGDLFAAAERVLALEPRVERIVVETTGLADPLPVGLTFLQTALRSRTSLNPVITVVDCANFALDLFKSDAAMAQIIHGDIIVLNKVDLATKDQVEALERRIEVLKPRVRILRAQHGRIPASAVVDPIEREALQGDVAKSKSHLLNDGFGSYSFRFDRAILGARFQAWLDHGIPRGVFRAKGIVHFERAGSFVFQLCGARAAFEPYLGSISDSRLVFIGHDLSEPELRRDLEECLSARSEPSRMALDATRS